MQAIHPGLLLRATGVCGTQPRCVPAWPGSALSAQSSAVARAEQLPSPAPLLLQATSDRMGEQLAASKSREVDAILGSHASDEVGTKGPRWAGRAPTPWSAARWRPPSPTKHAAARQAKRWRELLRQSITTVSFHAVFAGRLAHLQGWGLQRGLCHAGRPQQGVTAAAWHCCLILACMQACTALLVASRLHDRKWWPTPWLSRLAMLSIALVAPLPLSRRLIGCCLAVASWASPPPTRGASRLQPPTTPLQRAPQTAGVWTPASL